jgi:ABC-type phosphate/phosphonate transport system substrate-binding protein
MCGLPFSRAEPQPVLMAAPVPSPPEFENLPQYWSDFVVREDSAFRTLDDTYGGRIAFTVPDSQSGCLAALSHFMSVAQRDMPLFREVIAPTDHAAGQFDRRAGRRGRRRSHRRLRAAAAKRLPA